MTDPHRRQHHYAQGLVHSPTRDLIRSCLRGTAEGFGAVVSAVSGGITWLLTNAINLIATVGDNATAGGTSATHARVYDDTNGLLIEEIPAGAAVSEGMRYASSVFYNDDGSGNALHPVKVGSEGEDIYLLHEPRVNNESVTSEDYRTTGDADPHNFYYQQQAMPELVDNMTATAFLVAGANTVENDGTGTIKVTYVNSGTAGYFKLNDTYALSENLTVGNTYLISGTAWVNSGGQVSLTTQNPFVNVTQTLTQTQDDPFEFSFAYTPTTATLGTITIASFHPGETFWLKDVSVTLLPSTSLTPLLRNSAGQYYEELVKNGDAAVDAEFTKGTGWTLGTDSFDSDGSQSADSDLTQTIAGLTENLYYYVTFTATRSAGTITPVIGDTEGTGRTSAATFSEIIQAGAGTDIDFRADADFIGTVTGMSLYECVSASDSSPTNVLDGGRRQSNTNVLLNSDAPATQTPSLSTGFYTLWATGTGTATVAAGTATIDTSAMGDVTDGTDGSYLWFEVTGAGTVTVTEAGTVDTFDLIAGAYTPLQSPHISTTSGSVQENENVDESVLWSYGGKYSNLATADLNYLPHILNEPAATNQGLHARDMTQTEWAKTTMTAAKDQTGFDGSANGASSLLATAGNATCLQTYTIASAEFVASADIKRITGTGTVEFTVDNGATWIDITASLSTDQWYRAEATKTAANPIFGFRLVTDTDKIAVDFTGIETGAVASSRIPTTTGSVQRNATSFTSTEIVESNFTRYRVASILSQTFFSDGTNILAWDGTDLTFTDGVTTLTAASLSLVIGDTIVVDTAAGKLYVNGTLKDTDAAIAVTWGTVTAISNVTDIRDDSLLDPTDTTWDDPT